MWLYNLERSELLLYTASSYNVEGMIKTTMVLKMRAVVMMKTNWTITVMVMMMTMTAFPILLSRPIVGESAHGAGDHIDGLGASPKDVQLRRVAR